MPIVLQFSKLEHDYKPIMFHFFKLEHDYVANPFHRKEHKITTLSESPYA